MKSNYLKLTNPCQEKWENMKPNAKGSFCDSCSKNVIDFTQLNSNEISNIVKETKGSICARFSQNQLNEPLIDEKFAKEYSFPFSNVAAGVMIATTLTMSQKAQAETIQFETEYVQQTDSGLKSENNKPQTSSKHKESKATTSFRGRIISIKNGKPIENAKITFVTIQKIVSVYSQKDGTFLIELPVELIDNDNVIRVSYEHIAHKKDIPFGYETTDYILSKQEINSEYVIKARPEVLYLGGIGFYSEKSHPIVIDNGIKIKYKDFIKARAGKKSSCSLKNKDYYYFSSKTAIAIYGKEAIHGLYILTDTFDK